MHKFFEASKKVIEDDLAKSIKSHFEAVANSIDSRGDANMIELIRSSSVMLFQFLRHATSQGKKAGLVSDLAEARAILIMACLGDDALIDDAAKHLVSLL